MMLIESLMVQLLRKENGRFFNFSLLIVADPRALTCVQMSTPLKGTYPWQVRLGLFTDEGIYMCGGSILSENWIMTAAHW